MPHHQPELEEFTNYYETHKQAIFNYLLYRLSFNRDTAEDLTSEIFLKAFQAFDRYDRSRPFKAWIFAIAHNHLINHYAGRKLVLPLDEARNVGKEERIAENADEHMLISQVLHLVSKLPELQRDLVIMRYVNDLTNSEISAITGKEEGAVRTALSRAIGSLRDAYNKEIIFQKS